MLDKKKSMKCAAVLLLAGAGLFSGCTPEGPRALDKGIKLLDAGENDAAYGQLKLAATLIKTNAVAWDYLGVAAQRTGQPGEAASAYQRALELDRDLVEAHFNLGCLYMEQNQAELARQELASYTMRRSNDPEGWRKLGSVQLRLGETVAAQRSFSSVLQLSPDKQDAEAYNGLGVASMQLSRPHDAVRWFAAAVRLQPDYAAAILNLATTSQQYLRDNQTALVNYQKYLALSPKPDNWDAVNAIVQRMTPSAQPSPLAVAPPLATNPVLVATGLTVAPVVRTAPAPATRLVPVVRSNPPVQPRPAVAANAGQPQVIRLAPEPVIVTHPGPVTAPPANTGTFTIAGAKAADPALVAAMENDTPPPAKPGFWQRIKPAAWFHGDTAGEPAEAKTDSKYIQSGLTPLSTADAGSHSTAEVVVPTTPITRYHYQSPPRPAAGDHRSASGAYTKAQLYEQDERWSDAMVWYGEAAKFDPAWFEAHYNEGYEAERTRNYGRALAAYEGALAVRPDSTEARYHFGLVLKDAGHPLDALNELQKVAAAHPDEVRVHLALANLYAQWLHQPARARQEFNTVLQLAPNHPQAAEIRAWLNAN